MGHLPDDTNVRNRGGRRRIDDGVVKLTLESLKREVPQLDSVLAALLGSRS